jgi:hypothetical protein
VLSGLVKKIVRDALVSKVETPDDVTSLQAVLADHGTSDPA